MDSILEVLDLLYLIAAELAAAAAADHVVAAAHLVVGVRVSCEAAVLALFVEAVGSVAPHAASLQSSFPSFSLFPLFSIKRCCLLDIYLPGSEYTYVRKIFL